MTTPPNTQMIAPTPQYPIDPTARIAELELRLRASDTAKDLLLDTLFVALHQMLPYYADLASKDARPAYGKVHVGNCELARNAMKAYDEYAEEKGGSK